MVKNFSSAIAATLLTALLSANAAAATEREAHAQLDRAPAVAAE